MPRQLGETNSALVDLPRLVIIWRSDRGNADRVQWSARPVESWLLAQNWQKWTSRSSTS